MVTPSTRRPRDSVHGQYAPPGLGRLYRSVLPDHSSPGIDTQVALVWDPAAPGITPGRRYRAGRLPSPVAGSALIGWALQRLVGRPQVGEPSSPVTSLDA
jgi:hypothetical protein